LFEEEVRLANSAWKNLAKLLGIDDLFFCARDPQALSAWYHRHFAITTAPADYNQMPWQQQGGATVFVPSLPIPPTLAARKAIRW
jgi:hypothetical protein